MKVGLLLLLKTVLFPIFINLVINANIFFKRKKQVHQGNILYICGMVVK